MEGEQIMADPPKEPIEAPVEARRLVRAARVGTLATLAAGQPFATLVTPATAPDLSILLLLSSLAEHTRHLRADPRCSLLVVGVTEAANPQTAPRVTLTGLAEPERDPGLRARWLAVHPYGAMYADFADFALWRLRPAQALFVGGFARASRLRHAELAPDPAAVAAIAKAAADILVHCNRDHPEAMEAIAAGAGHGRGAWAMVGVDVDGGDLALGERVVRVPWSSPCADAGEVRAELVRLAKEARAGAPGGGPLRPPCA
jgi:hypothetical protein